MIRSFRAALALALAATLFGTAASAQTYTLPEIGLQNSGASRSLAVRDRTSNTMVPFGYVDTSAKDFVSTARVPLRADNDVADYPASTRYLDKALGGLANRLPGTPSSGNLFKALQDVVDFYAYGGRADGGGFTSGHPLSSVTSLNGVNTSGYSLAQWQAFYSGCADSLGNNPVTALINQLDEIALQCVINKKTEDGLLQLPAGVLLQTKPIISGQWQLDVRGASGPYSTKLIQRVAGQDGWRHGTSDTPYPNIRGIKLSFTNINFGCGPFGSGPNNKLVCGTAIKASFLASSAGFTMTDVGISAYGNQTFNYWQNGINCNNCSLTNMLRVAVGGANTQAADANSPNLQTLGTGIAFTGNHAVQFLLRDVTTNYWRTAISTQSGDSTVPPEGSNARSGTDLEGFVFDNWQANQVYDGLVVQNQTGGNNFVSPGYVITNGQFNVAHRWLYMAQVSDVFINNNLIYGAGSGAQTGGTTNYTQYVGAVTGSGAGGQKVVTLTASAPGGLTAGVPFFGPNVPTGTTVASVSGASVTLSNNLSAMSSGAQYIYGAGSPGSTADEFIVFNNVQRVTLRDNTFNIGLAANIGMFARFNTVSNGLVTNNRLQGVFNFSLASGFYNETANSRLIERDNYFTGISGWFNPVIGAGNGAENGNRFFSYYKANNTAVRSDLSLQYDGSQPVTLDANKQATVAFPPVFTASPTSIIAQSGDFDVGPVLCGPRYSTLSTTGVTVSCPAAAAGATIRINFSVSGPR